jgi:hypothetical protein
MLVSFSGEPVLFIEGFNGNLLKDFAIVRKEK